MATIEPKRLAAIRTSARAFFQTSKPTHDWSHIERVYALAERIGHEEGCDMDIVRLAALLHDIGRDEADAQQRCHAELSAVLAAPILREHACPEPMIEHICDCIRTHRFRGDDAPATIEAQVLYDADKLDAIGAIGICRAYSYAGENGQKLYSTPSSEDSENAPQLQQITDHSRHTPVIEYTVKLAKIKKKMLTQTGRRLARERDAFMHGFFRRLQREVEGKE